MINRNHIGNGLALATVGLFYFVFTTIKTPIETAGLPRCTDAQNVTAQSRQHRSGNSEAA